MSTLLLGWFLVIVGALFILVGLARAGRETFSSGRAAAVPPAGIKGLLGDAAKFVEALVNVPQWLLMVFVGGYLLYTGQQVLTGQTPWPF